MYFWPAVLSNLNALHSDGRRVYNSAIERYKRQFLGVLAENETMRIGRKQ